MTRDFALSWRGLVITITLAGVAAFVGARLGSERRAPRTAPLSERVFDLIGDDRELTAQKREAIQRVGDRYAPARERLRQQSQTLNARLLGLMAEEQRFGPKTEDALAQLQLVMGERLKMSMEYMLEVRQQLTPDQRNRFDRRLAEEAGESR